MPFETYSKRRRRLEVDDEIDVYRYDYLPDALRVQLVYAYQRATKQTSRWLAISYDMLLEEYGSFALAKQITDPYGRRLKDKEALELLKSGSVEQVLDFIDISMSLMTQYYVGQSQLRKGDADLLASEINHRFREHAVGYHVESEQIMRVDSELVHEQVVVPALQLLRQDAFKPANIEFLTAHEHYRHGRYEEAIVGALKAFESTLRIICNLRSWDHPVNPNAKQLIDTVLLNELIPQEMQNHFSGFRSAMESGLPTIRNRNGGHGRGPAARVIPDYVAAHALHLAAANIVYTVEAHNAKA